MRITTYQGETKLADLVGKLFDTNGLSPEKIQKLEQVLLQANPHLADVSKLSVGTLIAIPEVPDVQSAEPSTTREDAWSIVLEQLGKALTAVGPALKERGTRRVATAKNRLQESKDEEAAGRTANAPNLLDLETKRAEAEKQYKEAKEFLSAQKKLMPQLLTNLDNLQKVMSRRG